MYYKVISDGKIWYSKEIVKAHFHCGDDAVQRKLLEGSITACTIFDRIVYSVAKSEHKKIDEIFSPVIQDLDKAAKDFVPLSSAEAQFRERISYDKREPVYVYKDLKFIKFNAIRCRSKYHMQYRLPVMEVCGFKFVALNCIKSGEGYIVY